MRSNRRPAVALSELPPDQVNLRPGEVLAVACPICGRWRRIKRRMIWPHRAHDGVTRCPGSGQKVLVDLTPGQWLASLETARRQARQAVSLQRATERALRQARPRRRPEPDAA